jgi:glucose-1-phosphate thymidylyltransferase
MKAIIPAAGIGTRLRPHTLTIPKALLLVAGRPILGHILDGLHSSGIDEFVVVVGYHGDRIREFVARDHANKRVTFVEQEQRKGLGHAVWMCRDVVGDGPSLVILGDTIVRADIPAVVRSPENVIAVCPVDDPRRFGVVEATNGVVTRFVEKPEHPQSDLAIVGLYTFQESKLLFSSLQRLVDEDIRTKGEFQLTDAMQIMLEKGQRFVVHEIDGWHDCGKPETLLETNRILLGPEGRIHADGSVVIKDPVEIHPSAHLRSCIIGPHVTIGPGATIRDAVIADSIVNEGAQVDGVVLRASLVGPYAEVQGRGASLNVGDYSRTELH